MSDDDLPDYDEFVLRRALEEYGEDAQLFKLGEECNELSRSVFRNFMGLEGEDDLVSEIADVKILIRQMEYMLGGDEIESEVERKLKRLERRLEE